MASLLFYDNVVALNRERHADLRLQPGGGDYRFAAGTHYVPLAGTEFYQAAGDYPIVFAGGEDNSAPVALLGLKAGQNNFVGSDGRWRASAYVPAFVRRYPFVLARAEDADDGSDELTVCIDENHGGFNRKEGEALFDEDCNQTPYLDNTVRFLQQYLAETERTRQFAGRLNELGLLVRRDVQFTDADGGNYILRDFRVIDEDSLDGLTDEATLELHKAGFLGWIHAHLVSMARLDRFPALLERAG